MDARACNEHTYQPADNCGPCKTDAIVDGDAEALGGWFARFQQGEVARQIPPRYQGARADEPEVLAWLAQWREHGTRCPSLLLTGNVGTGKTWQAYGAIKAAVTEVHPAVNDSPPSLRGWRPTRWIATTSADMYAALRPQPKVDSEAALAAYRDTELLMIDDLGAAKTSEWVEEITYRIIGGRYDAMLPTIYTTNVPTAKLREAIGDRITSRLAETCTRVALTGEDRRRVKAA